MPFDNLTGDPAWNWAGAAVPAIVATEMSASLKAFPLRARDINEATAAGATRFVQGYITVEDGRLRIRAVEENASTHRRDNEVVSSGDPGAGVVPLADSLAREFGDHRVRRFGSQNPTAVRAWGEALATQDIPARMASFERAISTDPAFGECYLALAETHYISGDRAGAQDVLERARSHENLFTDYDRARVDLLASELSGNVSVRRRALMALSRLSTTDPTILERLGTLEYGGRRFQAAVDAFRSALALSPTNGQIANMLGYAEVLRGNLDGAVEAMARYARIAPPRDPNPSDSLGDVYFFAGRFDSAEKAYLEAQAKGRSNDGLELLKAAQSRLMTGDSTAADAIFERYAALRRAARDPLLEIQTARWRYLEGRQKEAIAALESVVKGLASDYTTYRHVQLAVWYLVAGQAGRAQDHASTALQQAQTPQAKTMGVVARFLAQPKGDASQWMMSAEQTFGPVASPIKTLSIAYGLLLNRQFGPASEPLRSMYEQTPPALDSQVRTLYAWTLVETGRKTEAGPLVELYAMPLGPGEALFSTLVFPRFFYVRGKVMQALVRDSDARSAFEIFRKFRGDLPAILPSGT